VNIEGYVQAKKIIKINYTKEVQNIIPLCTYTSQTLHYQTIYNNAIIYVHAISSQN